MAFLPYVRVVIRGTMRTAQTWSCGFSVHNDGTATSGELFTYLGALDGLAKTWLGNEIKALYWDTTTKYLTMAAYSYPAVGGAGATAGLASSGVVGTATESQPTQLAVLYSLRSGIAGRPGRGRFYLPFTGSAATTTDGQLTLTTLTTASNDFKTFFDAAQALSIGAVPATWVIASRDSGAGAPVITLQLGSKLRTQRRRTDKIGQDNNVITAL